MKRIIIIFVFISFTALRVMSQGYYFNIDKQQIFDKNNKSKMGIQEVDLTYIFDSGGKKIVERNNATLKFVVYDVSNIDVDDKNNKETWFVITPSNDSLIVLIDFTELESHNVTLGYFHKDYSNSGRLWQHAAHFRTFTQEQVEEFINKLYR